jgi:hypothetical protein
MEVLWTTIVFAVVIGPVLVATYILFRWFDGVRH